MSTASGSRRASRASAVGPVNLAVLSGVQPPVRRHGEGQRGNSSIGAEQVLGVDARCRAQPHAWASRSVSSPVTAWQDFADWAGAMRPDDDDDLAALGLPTRAELRRLGKEPAATGLYLPGAPPAVLRQVLADPDVLTVRPVASRLALPGAAS